jgi:hypothetical protein
MWSPHVDRRSRDSRSIPRALIRPLVGVAAQMVHQRDWSGGRKAISQPASPPMTGSGQGRRYRPRPPNVRFSSDIAARPRTAAACHNRQTSESGVGNNSRGDKAACKTNGEPGICFVCGKVTVWICGQRILQTGSNTSPHSYGRFGFDSGGWYAGSAGTSECILTGGR